MAQRVTTPLWKGSPDLREQPGSPDWQYGDTVQVTRIFEGPAATVFANRPGRGAVMPDLGTEGVGLGVSRVRITPSSGGKARLTVVLTGGAAFWLAGEEAEGPPPPVVEIDWQAVTKDIRYHPIYQAGGTKELDDEDRKAVDTALQDLDKPVPWADGSSAEHLFKRLLRGQESYTLYAPIVRRTTFSVAYPDPGQVGAIESPPIEPTGEWQWRKTADTVSFRGELRISLQGEGYWERREEWTGADELDTDIYS